MINYEEIIKLNSEIVKIKDEIAKLRPLQLKSYMRWGILQIVFV